MKYLKYIGWVVVALAIIGGYFYPKLVGFGTVSTSSTTTFNEAKLAEAGFAPSTATATTTSILNTSATDRIVTSSFYYCNGIGTSRTAFSGTGLANITISAATTSTANPVISITNANLVLSSNLATTSAGASSYVSSTTTPFPDDSSRIWAAGSYMTFFSNATNTAQCVVGLYYLGS